MKITQNHSAGEGINSLNHYNLVHKNQYNLVHNFFYASSNEKTGCEGCSGQIMAKLVKIPAWQLTKVRNKKDVIDEVRKDGKTVHFASSMDLCHLKNFGVGAQISKIQRWSCAPRWYSARWFRLLRSIYRARIICVTDGGINSNGCHCKVTRIRRTSSGRNICLHPSQNGRWSIVVENSKVSMSRYLDTSTKTQMAQIMVQYGRPSRSSWAKSVRSSSGMTIMGKAFRESSIRTRWGKVPKWECLFLSVYVDDIKLAGKNQNMAPMWKVLVKDVDLGEPTSFLDHDYLVCTQRECETRKDIVDNYRNMFESKISAWATKKLLYSEKLGANISSGSYDMECHATKCVERYCELANRTTQQLYKVATPCLDDHQFKEEEMGSARFGRTDIPWSVNKLARAVTKWTRACDKRLLVWYLKNTTRVTLSNVVVWHNNADWNCFRTLTLPEIPITQNRLRGESCVFLEVTRLFP